MGHPRRQHDRPPARGHPGAVPVAEAECGGVSGAQVDLGPRRDGVEGVGPAGHRAGVPVLEQPPGVEHERELLVGQFLGGQPFGGHQVGQAVVGVELLAEHHHDPVAVLGIGVRVQLAGQPEIVVAEVGVAGHDGDDLAEDLPRAGVVPAEPDPVGDVLHDLPVHPGLPRRVEHLPAELHPAVGVGVGAVLLQVGRRGQDDVGELGGLGQEDVLDDEEVQRRQRLADLVDVGVGQERVLPEHVHPAHAALER